MGREALNWLTTQSHAAVAPPDDGAGETTRYTYDTLNHLIRVDMPGVPARPWTYDGPRLIGRTQPESGTTAYTYDAAGRVTSSTDALGQLTQWTYDGDGRTTHVNVPGTLDDVTVAYDPVYGRVTSQATGRITTTFAYDTAGRLASRADLVSGLTFTSAYTYDANDGLTALTYPSGRVVGYGYDPAGRLSAVTNNGASFAHAFTYGDTGALASYQTGSVVHTFAYDTRDRVARLTALGPGAVGLDLSYAYDRVHQVWAITDPRPGRSQSFGYDLVDRLTTASGPWGQVQWTYDVAGNRVSETGPGTTLFHYSASTQRLTSTSGAGAETFAYDAAGRLTADSRGAYTYAPSGQLAQVTGATLTASSTYDAQASRLVRTVNGQTSYTVRSAAGLVLSEYEAPCAAPVWRRDVVYALGRPLGAIASTAATATVSVSAATVSTDEATTVPVTVLLSTPGGTPLPCAVTVAYHTMGGTGVSGDDFAARSGTLLFGAGSAHQATQTIAVPVVADALDEDDETFEVALSSASGATLGAQSRTTVTIVDDDARPFLRIDDVSVAEGWSQLKGPIRLAPALFVDTARAWRGGQGTDERWHSDIGAGIRVAIPGAGVLRLDLARSLRDRNMAISVALLIANP